MIRNSLAVLLLALLLSGCSSNSTVYEGSYGYENDYDTQEQPDPPLTSDNWDCTGDCSGHDAGYEWASDKGISDPNDCGGNSDSFIEGCEAWANEQQIEADQEEQDRETEQDSDYQYDYAY